MIVPCVNCGRNCQSGKASRGISSGRLYYRCVSCTRALMLQGTSVPIGTTQPTVPTTFVNLSNPASGIR